MVTLFATLPLVLALTLGLAPAATAATLYSPPSSGGGGGGPSVASQTTWIAQSFTPTTSGTARVLAFYARYYGAAQTTNVEISLYTDNAGNPGNAITPGAKAAVANVDDTLDAEPFCASVQTPPQLTAGTKYWAVFRTTHPNEAQWYGSGGTGSKRSTDNGGTWGPMLETDSFNHYLLVLDGNDCLPDISSIPAPGTGEASVLGDMYARAGGSGFQTLYVTNTSNLGSLNLTGGSFSGNNPGMFRVLDGEPTGAPPGKAFPFPKNGVGRGQGGTFLYIACTPPVGTPDGMYRDTFTLTSNDPDESPISWPVWCLVDSTPPSVEFTQSPDGRSGWFVTRPAPILARGVDPESNNFVIRIFCTDNGEVNPAVDSKNGSVAQFKIAPDGVHNLACQATDAARNTSSKPGGYTTTVKVDGTPPETTGTDGPPARANLNQRDATFAFTGSDATSGFAGEFECRLDGGAYAPCSSGTSRSGLRDGVHTFEVRARDVAGNWDPTPAHWVWRVETERSRAIDDAAAVTAGNPLDVDVLANDADPLGRPVEVVLDSVTTDQGGSVALADNRVRYLPPAGFVGTDTFTYRLTNDSGSESEPARVSVQVAANPLGDPTVFDRLAPTLKKLKLSKRTLSFTLSEPARTTVTVYEIVKGRKKPVKRGKVNYIGLAGSNKLPIKATLLKKGRRYRLAVTAVDAAGNTSKKAGLTARVR